MTRSRSRPQDTDAAGPCGGLEGNGQGSASPLRLGPLRDNLGYLSRALRSVGLKTSGAYVSDLGFLAGQMVMLGLIAANDRITQNELAGAMLMKKSQVTHLIHDLVARGLVTREEHATDRRFNALRLTSAGVQTWQRTQMRIDAHSAHMFSPLAPAERAQMATLLRKLLAHHLQESGIDFS